MLLDPRVDFPERLVEIFSLFLEHLELLLGNLFGRGRSGGETDPLAHAAAVTPTSAATLASIIPETSCSLIFSETSCLSNSSIQKNRCYR